MRRLIAWLAVVGMASGCGGAIELATREDDDDNDTRVEADGDDVTTTTAGRRIEAVEDRFVGDSVERHDEVVLAALQDVETYWETEFPEVFGDEFEPVEGGFFAYGPDSDPVPCGSPPPTYDEIADNAFYCPPVDLIAWDTFSLIPALQEDFGDFTLGIVMAHEYAHAIQSRADLFGLTITLEQQADCWAGSWTAWVRDGKAQNFNVSLEDLDAALAGFLLLRDAIGTPATDPGAHGSAFDRIGAFQDGFLNGAAACVDYEDDNLDVADLPFSSQEDFERGGDAPFDDVEAFTVADLDNFWTLAFPAVFDEEWTEPDALALFPSDEDELPPCGERDFDGDDLEDNAFYCEPDDYVAWDEENLMPALYDEIGDFAMSTVIGTQYSLAAQAKLGTLDDTLESNLQADCFTGAWVASSVLRDRGTFDPANPDDNPTGNVFVLSPGDLDEAVIAFLRDGERAAEFDPGAEGSTGTAFLRLTAFRTGFITALEAGDSLAGVDHCANDLEPGDD